MVFLIASLTSCALQFILYRCPVPTSHVRRALKRVIIVAPPCIFYVPEGALEEYYSIFKKENGTNTTSNSRGGGTKGGKSRHDEDRQLARRLQEVSPSGLFYKILLFFLDLM